MKARSGVVIEIVRVLVAAFMACATKARNIDGTVGDLPGFLQFRTDRLEGFLITQPFATLRIADQAPDVVRML